MMSGLWSQQKQDESLKSREKLPNGCRTNLSASYPTLGQSLPAWIFKMDFARNGFTPLRFEYKIGQAMGFAISRCERTA
jgi:hypothetical protein